MAEIVLKNLVKKFHKVTAVDGIDLTVKDREFLVLVGPSGCGKTTALRMIAGLDDVTDGDIYIGGRKVNDIRPKDRDIAMVFQNYALYPHMNVYKNMAFGLRMRKMAKDKIDSRVTKVADMLEILKLLERKPKELSGGQRQRVAMGRAIVRKPQAFLFDEPLSNLDAKLRVQMRVELAKLHQRLETTVVYVTHDQTEAMTLADRIVIMNNGRIMQIGDPLDVYNNPKNYFVAGFIGSPAMNLIDLSVKEAAGRLYLSAENFSIAVPESLFGRYQKAEGKEAIWGIRPEHIFDKAFKAPFPGGESLSAIVEVVEPLGSQIILLATCGSFQITACVDPQTRATLRKEKAFIADMNKMHLFDPKTGDVY